MTGRRLSHYCIVSELGGGGMGVVYAAEDTRLGRRVAVKILPPAALSVPGSMVRFQREARIISSLNHPHICTLYDVGEADGEPFMVMELLEGESLEVRIQKGPLPIETVLEFGAQVADALDAAHRAGVIHRDVKPANLFVTAHGEIKVLDFGVAKIAEPERQDPESAPTSAGAGLTTLGSAIGTMPYMSPEQARGVAIDARSDLFSLGAVLYEMTTGRAAFAAATPGLIFESILTKTPPTPSSLRHEVPAELDRIIAKAMEKDAGARYQGAAEVRADLKQLLRDRQSAAIAAAGVRHGGGVRAWLVAGPLATAAIVGAVVLWQSQRTPALTPRDTVVLADFENRTGDAAFDGTLTEALGLQLRQSPFLLMLPEQEVQSMMRMMGKGAAEPLTAAVARELCQRAGARATLSGAIASLGSSYLLTLRAQDCVSGGVIAEAQQEAAAKEGVIKALGSAATGFRTALGESLATVQRYEQNIEVATTASLDALKAYSQAISVRRTQGDAAAVPLLTRAIELDPKFALAHARLGTILNNLGRREAAAAAATRAFELRDRVSERERLYIEARYYTTVPRDFQKAAESYQVLLASYPDDFAALTNLGSLNRTLGRQKEAIAALEHAVRVAPSESLAHTNLAGAYSDERRFAESARELQAVVGILDTTVNRSFLFTIASFAGDRALANSQMEAVRGRPDEISMIYARAAAAGIFGRLREVDQLFAEGWAQLEQKGMLAAGMERLASMAGDQAVTGRIDVARAAFRQLQRVPTPGDAADDLTRIAALIGDARAARVLGERAIAALPPGPDLERNQLTIQSMMALADGRLQDAYDQAKKAMAGPTQSGAAYVAGVAALRLKHWDDAASAFPEFEKVIPAQTSAATVAGQIYLARAHAAAGRTREARHAFEKAFEVWKDADADLPLLVEARAEYKRLAP